MSRGLLPNSNSSKFLTFNFVFKCFNPMLRNATTKLPTEIRKKVEEWKFSSGVQVLCLVAYSDGQDVQTFQ
jgi:hypothetical protein